MKIFNSLSSSKEDFTPLNKDKIKLYVCGMTVYDDCHIGHARTFLTFDLFVRFFSFLGFDVNYIRNITDIEDKIIDKALLEKVKFNEISNRFIISMNEDFKKLNLLSPNNEPKASDHINEILEMIETLESNDYAYSSEGGDVYFDISSYEEYGKLSKRNLDELDAGVRIEIDKFKKNPNDFVLWKKTSVEPNWDSKWGKGRPGWHIECSAMSKKFLGENFDIHGGGLDLKFPHHENEIAQSECCSGKNFANYWMHVAPLNVEGKKMSKSLNNFVTIKKVLEEFHPEVMRMFFYLTHYRKPINFTTNSINEAKNILDKFYKSLGETDFTETQIDLDYKNKFEESLRDDFNTPKAIKILQELVQKINKTKSLEEMLILKFSLKELSQAIGLLNDKAENYFKYSLSNEISEAEIEELVFKRNDARQKKDFQKADDLRNVLLEKGIVLEDKADETYWVRKKTKKVGKNNKS